MIRKVIINGNGTAGRICRAIYICALTAVMFSFIAEALPPSEIITCYGCELAQSQENGSNFITWVAKGTTITLNVPVGCSDCSWSIGGSVPSISIQIDSDRIITLTSNGKVKTVQINLKSSGQGNCVPGLSNIKVDSLNLAVGQEVTIKEELDESQCSLADSGAVFSWIIEGGDSSGISIKNVNILETQLRVLRRSTTGINPVLKARVEKGVQAQEKSVIFNVIDNTPPTIAGKYSYTTPLSNREFKVECDQCWPGSSSAGEAGDHISFLSVTVTNAKDGSFVAYNSDSVSKDEDRKPAVTLTLGDECDCIIEVNATDSFGASTMARDVLPVGFGNTEYDAPNIKIKEPVAHNGPEYIFDTQATNDHGLGISRHFYYRTVTGFEPLSDMNGNECRSPVCKTTLSSDTEIKVTMQYMRDGKPSGEIAEKTLTVSAGGFPAASQSSVQPSHTIAQRQQSQDQSVNENKRHFSSGETRPAGPGACGEGYPCQTPKIPSVEISAVIAAIVIASWRSKK